MNTALIALACFVAGMFVDDLVRACVDHARRMRDPMRKMARADLRREERTWDGDVDFTNFRTMHTRQPYMSKPSLRVVPNEDDRDSSFAWDTHVDDRVMHVPVGVSSSVAVRAEPKSEQHLQPHGIIMIGDGSETIGEIDITTCQACSGTGYLLDEVGEFDCPVCDGDGVVCVPDDQERLFEL